MARENFGQSEYVRPSEDIEEHMSKLYKHIESPVLTGLRLEFAFDEVRSEQGKPVNRVYPKDSFDLFAGEQLVVVGRYKRPGTAKVIVKRLGQLPGAEVRLPRHAALLGSPENGMWRIPPAETPTRISRRYRPGTLVLETVFGTA